MNYCTLEDIRGHVPDARLVEVTDDLTPNADGEIKQDIVGKAIEESSTLIDAYIGKRYRLPLPSVPSVLRSVCVDLSIYNLYERITEMNISEGMKLRYDNAIALLMRIADGKASIGLEDGNKAEEAGFKVMGTNAPSMFTLESMSSL